MESNVDDGADGAQEFSDGDIEAEIDKFMVGNSHLTLLPLRLRRAVTTAGKIWNISKKCFKTDGERYG